ncbi:hypothetical protein UFOVP570_21 [uncultured Caudovirales phage]|uniref:Uncharacterized protein n=1 Tax=uncultured Caudovirales phage TaxID=2100421 RepID=A0A6J5MUD8_9CAUD|nr:hypothetical protein UFOVP570_21 [uncultured Caudovirales phage]
MKILQVQLEPKDIADIVHCAIEGGINYWGECQNYKWSEWYEPDPARSYKNEHGTYEAEKVKDLPDDYVYVEIKEDEDNGEPTREVNDWFPIRKADIERGFALAFAKHPHLYHARDGEVDMDATGGEVIMQYAIFGELIYG